MKKKKDTVKKKKINADELIIDDVLKEKPKKEKKHYWYIILLVLSIVLLLGASFTYLYIKSKNENEVKDVNNLKENMTKVNDKITSNKETKKEKESEYEKLQNDYKQELEELGIWEELEETLQKSLS